MTSNFFVNNINSPDMTSLFELGKQNIFSNLNCVKVGYIDSYDYDTRVSRVVIYNKLVVSVNDKGEHITQDYPPLYCKTLFLGGSNCGLEWDIQAGDECIIFFNDRELESCWLSGQISDLQYQRMHNITDAICITGFRTLPKTVASSKGIKLYSDEKITLSADNDIIISSQTKTNIDKLHATNGASGSFVSEDNKIIIVEDGVITSIE